MSTYQYYDFLSIDRPLSKAKQAELRSASSRARITSTRFTNEYHWGDLRADPMIWMQKHFDLGLYLSNFGSRFVSLRVPKSLIDQKAIQPYLTDGIVEARETPTHIILTFHLEGEPGEYDDDHEGEGWLDSMLGVRESLLSGDLRPLYLGWLSGIAHDSMEPPLPPGLGTRDESLESFADFLHIDPDLLAVAARDSPPADSSELPLDQRKDWIASLTAGEKDVWLIRLLDTGETAVARELQQAFRTANTTGETLRQAPRKSRVLQDLAKEHREHREAREQADVYEKRRLRLLALAGTESAMWKSVIQLSETYSENHRNTAIRTLTDLRDLAALTGKTLSFKENLEALIELRRRRKAFMEKLRDAGFS